MDQDDTLNDLRKKIEADNLMTTETLPGGKKADFTTFILGAIVNYEMAMRTSRGTYKRAEWEAHQAQGYEKTILDEVESRIQYQEKIFHEREKLLNHLPMSRAVIPVYNALLEEQKRERILIAESSKAIRDRKADLRERTENRIKQADERCTREQDKHKERIERIRYMAKILGVEVEDTAIDGLVDRDFPSLSICWDTATCMNLATEPAISAEEVIDRVEEGNKVQLEMLRHLRKDLGSDIDNMLKGRHDHSGELISLQESILTKPTMVDSAPETSPNLNQEGLVKGLHDEIKICQYGIAEILHQCDKEVKATDSNYQLDIYSLKEMTQKRMAQKVRIETLQQLLGALWETKLPEWDQAWTLAHEEQAHIKEELEGLENQIASGEEKHNRRKNAVDNLLKQRVE
ncbi:hypothetical protein GMOD_00006563 [Pyrenophora seminiperda CCB06]|uniref:Uncharacterized protein n=1 Tax=Pyrenophora seminiperda CCB06 TaxID=1302712 RepID=A0A3M7MAF7_9PLEO|nr:hypothetical protein GMOD_00006563 [Pyrenophora seminiperda CCB06]